MKDTTTKPSDFNDLHQLKGLEMVQEQVNNAKKPEHNNDILSTLDPDLPWNIAGSDIFFAKLFIKEFGKLVRYVPTWGWLIWDEKRWKRDLENKQVENMAGSLFRNVLAWLERVKDVDELRKLVFGLAKQISQIRNIRSMLATAAGDPTVLAQPDEFDRDPYLLNCQNGVVDLRTGELMPHSPELKITKITPYSYNAEARSERFEKFLSEIFCEDTELIQFVQRALGYSMTGSVEEHKFFICWGTGRNGKSTLLNVVGNALGEYSKTIASDLLLSKKRGTDSHPTIKADLFGARLCVAQETEEGRYLACSTIKNLTGGENIRGRFMHKDYFEFKPTHTIWLGTNYKPIVTDTTPAMKERLYLIPFRAFFGKDERDPRLEQKLLKDGDAVLTWLVKGAAEWYQNGLGNADAVESETKNYWTDMDKIQAWLEDCCEINTKTATPFKALYEAYVEWHTNNANDDEPMARKAFGDRLSEKGFYPQKKRINGKMTAIRVGIKLKSETDETNDFSTVSNAEKKNSTDSDNIDEGETHETDETQDVIKQPIESHMRKNMQTRVATVSSVSPPGANIKGEDDQPDFSSLSRCCETAGEGIKASEQEDNDEIEEGLACFFV